MRTIIRCASLTLLLALVASAALYAGAKQKSSSKFCFDVPPYAIPKADEDTLIQWLQDADRPPGCRALAARQLGERRAESAAPLLRQLLSDQSTVVRLEAAGALLRLGDDTGLPIVRSQLSFDPTLRAAAILAANGDDSGLGSARQKLDSIVGVHRVFALQALAASADDETVYYALLRGVQDSDEFVRITAINLLGKRGSSRSVEILRVALSNHSQKMMRSLATRALAETKNTDAIPALIDALSDPEASIRVAASYRLNLLTGRKMDPFRASRPERMSEIEQDWRDWWETNKSKYPPGTQFEPPPRPKPVGPGMPLFMPGSEKE